MAISTVATIILNKFAWMKEERGKTRDVNILDSQEQRPENYQYSKTCPYESRPIGSGLRQGWLRSPAWARRAAANAVGTCYAGGVSTKAVRAGKSALTIAVTAAGPVTEIRC